MEEKRYIECGKIINTHGCHGGLKLESWCDSPEVLASFERIFIKKAGAYVEHRIKKASVFKQFVLFDLAGISDMDTALALKNTVVYVFFHYSLSDFIQNLIDFFICLMLKKVLCFIIQFVHLYVKNCFAFFILKKHRRI